MDNFTVTTVHCHLTVFGLCVSFHDHTSVFRTSKSQVLNCPLGFTVTGGGHSMSGNANLVVTQSLPEDADTWRVTFFNATNEGTNNLRARGRAQCVKVQ